MKRILLFILISLLLIGCTVGVNSKPSNVRDIVWNEGIQISIAINNAIENEKSPPSGVLEKLNSWENEGELTEEEQEIKQSILELNLNALTLSIAFLLDEENDEVVLQYQESYDKIIDIFGKGNLSADNLEEGFVDSLEKLVEEKKEDKKQEFILSAYDTVISADEVQYNMSNNLDKLFYLEGRVEICDYYNYGFKNEKDYFCGKLTPFDGGYTDSWYLYFNRDSFSGIYNLLLQGNIDLMVLAEVPSSVYKSGQGNMAWVRKTGSYH